MLSWFLILSSEKILWWYPPYRNHDEIYASANIILKLSKIFREKIECSELPVMFQTNDIKFSESELHERCFTEVF